MQVVEDATSAASLLTTTVYSTTCMFAKLIVATLDSVSVHQRCLAAAAASPSQQTARSGSRCVGLEKMTSKI